MDTHQYQPNHLLRRRRLQRRWTQVGLAVKLGVSPTTVNRWENGVQRPQLEQVERLCAIFAASAAELGLKDEALVPQSQSDSSGALTSPERTYTTLRSVPDLDSELVPTSAHDRVLADLVGADSQMRGRPRVVALRGPGGFGKTSLAKQLCHDPLVREEFSDGQVWVETGPDCTPARVAQLAADLCVQLGMQRPDVADPDQAGYLLAQGVGTRHLLLVVDNVWSAADLRPFLTGGPHATRLVTTQNAGVCPVSTIEHPVGPMATTEIEQLLRRVLPDADVDSLVPLCGGWPILARVVGASVRRDIDSGARPGRAIAEAERELRLSGPSAFDVWDSDHRTNAIGNIVRLGIDRLRQHVRIGPHTDLHERYLSLAAFPAGIGIPLTILTRWWSEAYGWTSAEVRRFCHELVDRSLVARYDADAATVVLHDVFRTYVRSALGDGLVEIGRSLLDAHRSPSGWLSVCERDPYFLANLSNHLLEAELRDEAISLLLEPGYLVTKAARLGHLSLQADVAVAAALRTDRGADAALAARLFDGAFLLFGMDSFDDITATLDCLAKRGGADVQGVSDLSLVTSRSRQSRFRTAWATRVSEGDDPSDGAHVGAVTSVAVATLDGEDTVVTGGEDGTIRIWSAGGGRAKATLAGHTGWVDTVAISGRRRLVATAGEDQVIRLWSVLDGAPVGALIGHSARVRSLAFSPSGRQLVSGAEDGRAYVWDVAEQRLIATLCDDHRRIWATAVDRDGRLVAIGGEDGSLRLIRCAAGGGGYDWTSYTVDEVAGHRDWIRSVAIATEVAMAVTGSGDGTIGLWRVRPDLAWERRLNSPGPRVRSVAVADDLSRIAAGCEDGTVRVWRRGKEVPAVFHSGSDWVRSVALAPTNDAVFAACEDGMLRAWDLDTGGLKAEFGRFQDVVWSAAWLATGFVAAGTASGRIDLRDAASGELIESLSAGRGRVWSVTADGTGRYLAAACGDGAVRLWDLQDRGPSVDLRTGEQRPWCVAMDPNGRRLAAGVGSGRVRVWDIRTGAVLIDAADHAARVRSLAFDVEGRRLVTGSGDGTVRVVDVEDSAALALDSEGEWVRAVAIDASGGYVAAGSGLGVIRVWDLAEAKPCRSFTGHTGRVLALRFTPSGRHMLSGAADGTVRYWDVDAGRELCRVRVDATLLTCAIDPSRRSVLAATARHLVAVSVTGAA